MKHFEVVAAILINGDRVFCAQRKDAGEVAKKWEFPGGKIEPGESHREALSREIAEELSIGIEIGDFVMTIHYQYATFAITMHAYRATILSGEPTLSEHLDSRWLSREELSSVDWAPADLPIVERIKEMLHA